MRVWRGAVPILFLLLFAVCCGESGKQPPKKGAKKQGGAINQPEPQDKQAQ